VHSKSTLCGVSWWDYPLETVYSYVPNFSEARDHEIHTRNEKASDDGSVTNLEDLFRATAFACQ
ncbi:7652_t:CDS:2, partial [Funneliformis caledonium]